MCFSAGASFGAGLVLAALGTVAVNKAQSPSHVAFAMIPFLFGVQQLAEGFLWLTESRTLPPDFKYPAMLLFLIFAQVIWPLWVPLSMWMQEPKGTRRNILAGMSVVGGVFALYHGFCLAVYPVTATVSCYHIDYNLDFPEAIAIPASILYLIVIIVPPFVSNVNRMHLLGWVNLCSFLLAALFYKQYLISVWCFFAALISVMVLVVLGATSYETAAGIERKKNDWA